MLLVMHKGVQSERSKEKDGTGWLWKVDIYVG